MLRVLNYMDDSALLSISIYVVEEIDVIFILSANYDIK